MNKTLLVLLLGVGAGFALNMLMDTEKGQAWRDKISDLLCDVSVELKDKILAEIDKFQTAAK